LSTFATGVAAAAATGVGISGTSHHPVRQVANAFDADRHLLPRHDRADPGRGPGEDHVAGQQGHRLGDVGDQVGDRPGHLRGAPGLPQLAVHRAGDGQVRGVHGGLDPRPQRAEGVEALGPAPLVLGALQVARRDVVAAGVAQHHLRHPGGRHLPAHPADHHRQLRLVLHVEGHADRVLDGVGRPDHRGRRLQEDHGRVVLAGSGVAEFGGVLGVVAPDADHLRRQHRGQQPYPRQRPAALGDLDRSERVAQDLGHLEGVGLVALALDDAELHLVVDGESSDAHSAILVVSR
jgi:hypothetical protein